MRVLQGVFDAQAPLGVHRAREDPREILGVRDGLVRRVGWLGESQGLLEGVCREFHDFRRSTILIR